jgi:hypothetical protein
MKDLEPIYLAQHTLNLRAIVIITVSLHVTLKRGFHVSQRGY